MEELMIALMKLQSGVDVLTAVGARLSAEPGSLPAAVEAAIDDVIAAAGLPDLGALAPPQRAMIAGMVRTMIGQSSDVLHNAARPIGWAYTDGAVLEGQGRASMSVPPMIAATGEFSDVRSLLDVGTGVGWLAVAAAGVWPEAEIVGVDVWGPSLERARANVAASGLADRIEIRDESVTDLSDRDRFDLTWVPSFYVAPDALPKAFESILLATRPGGRIAVGRFDPPPDPVMRAAQRLRTIRDGGAILSASELVELLTAAGWTDARPLPKPGPGPLEFVAATKA
jgi:SAM-dependent methyltransferase